MKPSEIGTYDLCLTSPSQKAGDALNSQPALGSLDLLQAAS